MVIGVVCFWIENFGCVTFLITRLVSDRMQVCNKKIPRSSCQPSRPVSPRECVQDFSMSGDPPPFGQLIFSQDDIRILSNVTSGDERVYLGAKNS